MGTLAHQSRWVSVGASHTVPQCKVLAIIVVEEKVVVCVVSWAIDDTCQGTGDTIVTIVDRDGPDVDENVQGQVEHFVQGEEEGVNVVWESLQEAVYRMKGMAGKRSGDLPYVVWFVKELLWDMRIERSERDSYCFL